MGMPITPRRVWQEDGSVITLVRGLGTLCTQTTADFSQRSARRHVGAASACPQLQGKPQVQALALLSLCLSTPCSGSHLSCFISSSTQTAGDKAGPTLS